MQIYFFSAGVESDELSELENRIRSRLPALQKLTSLEEVTRRVAEQAGVPESEQSFIVLPVLTEATSLLDRLIGIAEQEHRGIFFIFVSSEISASDYKRLVRGGGADWVSLRDAPREIEEIVSRTTNSKPAPARIAAGTNARPIVAVFLPSSGGVGNTTLALEAAVQLKLDKKTRNRRVCLLDLDLQTSHVCDYIDLEPRLQMREIVDDPERLDAQLFEVFLSHHSSGLDVLAAPRNRQDPVALNMEALDTLFGVLAARYELLIVDLPPQWSGWTQRILSVCDLVVVSGLNTVPGLRQVADTLQAVRSVEPVPSRVVVALNRCEPALLGRVARAQHIKRILPDETVLTVREDAAAAIHGVNTGIPITVGSPSSKINKDIHALAALLGGMLPAQH
jgi:pilus assembly protein CpaE